MHCESNSPTNSECLPQLDASDNTRAAWPATLDLSLETLNDVVHDLEIGHISHDRVELINHLCKSIEQIKAMLRPNQTDDLLGAPSSPSAASRPAVSTAHSSLECDGRIHPSREALSRGA